MKVNVSYTVDVNKEEFDRLYAEACVSGFDFDKLNFGDDAEKALTYKKLVVYRYIREQGTHVVKDGHIYPCV